MRAALGIPPRHRAAGPLREPYQQLKRLARTDLRSPETSRQILDLVLVSLRYLRDECETVDLNSQVASKHYFSYVQTANRHGLSRPVNRAFFQSDQEVIERQWRSWATGEHLNAQEIGTLTYTMAMAYCAASDLFDRNNKKGPATYFECLIGHLFARAFGVNPTKQARLLASGRHVRMTMDFLFDLGADRPKIHLPVKFSTRERVVQAWAHQRLLDASYGENTYRGILVVFSETKLDLVNRQVVEICVPDQWLAYQVLLATMHRIYYFDVPQRYLELARDFPVIQLRNFPDFFGETEEILRVH